MSDADKHIDAVLDLIGRGEWGPQRLREYAREHKLNIHTVRGYGSDAWRLHRKLRGDDGEYRQRLLANLDFAGRWARELDDVNAYIKAQDSQSKLLVDEPKDEELTETELDALIRARGYRKDTDATERVTEAAEQRSREDSGGERGEEKGRVEGFSEGDED